MKLSATQIGRMGEYYVCSLLERRGIEASRVDGKFDVVAILPSGVMLRIEVKTCSKSRGNLYWFHIGAAECDFYALYGLDGDVVRFVRPTSRYVHSTSISIRPDEFTPELAEQDIAELLAFTG